MSTKNEQQKINHCVIREASIIVCV